MKTTSVKPSDIKKQWVIVDAANQSVGRLASQIAYILRGKHKPTFTPYLDTGDHVVVINAEKVKFTGLKNSGKVYYHHTNYIGGIKAIKAGDLLAKNPERVIMSAVKGMLPHNAIGSQCLRNLRVYTGAQHPHDAQKPVTAPVRTLGEKGST